MFQLHFIELTMLRSASLTCLDTCCYHGLFIVLYTVYVLRRFTRRSRPSDLWFDKECRDAKRLTRRLERAYAAASRRSAAALTTSAAASEAAAARTAWYN